MDNKTLVFFCPLSSQDFTLKANKQGICCYQNLKTAVLWHHLWGIRLAVIKMKRTLWVSPVEVSLQTLKN